MDKPESKGLLGSLPVALILTLLAGFVFTYSVPYQDQRPSVSRPLKVSYQAAQDVDARLWQDPLEAVESVERTPASANAKDAVNTRDAGRIYQGDFIKAEDSIHVIAVTLPGGPYQEAAEQRMRWRYAMLSALANRKAAPLDSEHIGYFQPADGIVLQKRVPFEWWSLAEQQKILLLWLDESALFGRPAGKLKALLQEVRCAASGKTEQNPDFQYTVIGPNSSSVLDDMLHEKLTVKAKFAANSSPLNLEAIDGRLIQYYSAAATASDHDLLQGLKLCPLSSDYLTETGLALCRDSASNREFLQRLKACSSESACLTKKGIVLFRKSQSDQAFLQSLKSCSSVSGCLSQHGLVLYRTTATDGQLMQLLVAELDKRWIQPGLEADDGDHVAILSEWDTVYGRSMRQAFTEAWGREQSVHDYSYMRGLDGVLPGRPAEGGSSKSTAGKGGDPSDQAALIEYPEGRNQKDYLRRLADKIAQTDQSLKQQGFRRGIAAIGVLGSDVHDKLMILEALRQYFPHKLFFTTELNAIYNHPAKWKQTHNLLVASPFDLVLDDERQGGIPPFREAYQSAISFAAQLALEESPKYADLAKSLQPRLFEIGRHRAVPLSVNATDTLEQAESLPRLSGRQWWLNMGLLVSGLLLIPLVSWRARNGLAAGVAYLVKHLLPTTLIVIAVGGAGVLLVDCWQHYLLLANAEPNDWLEGVSFWPSQWLRLTALLFAIAFFIWGRRRISAMQTLLQAREPGNDEGSAVFALPKYDACVDPLQQHPCNVLFVGSWRAIGDSSQPYLLPDQLWTMYLCYQNKKKLGIRGSCLRILLHGLAFWVFAMLLVMWGDMPNTPARGDFAQIVNIALLCLAVPATIGLTMWVAQNGRLCERLISLLSEKPSQWNTEAREFAVRELKVARDCVEEWLDIQLVVVLTKTMQPLIWGPIVCTALLMLARSPAIDDWDTPWSLAVVFAVMLAYTISTEVLLQRGAEALRAKVIKLWNGLITARREQEDPDLAAISRIEQALDNTDVLSLEAYSRYIAKEVDGIKVLREGAFRPWYEWPLLRSFGGFGSFVLLLQYLLEMMGGG